MVKKKKAASELGVARKRKRKAVGSQIVFWVTACRSCFSWSLTVSKSVFWVVFSSVINQAVAHTISGKDAVIKKIVWVLKCCSREPLR